MAVKLKKSDKEISWDSLGYDIKEFTIPKRAQMKSNFLSLPVQPREEPKPVESEAADKENQNTENQSEAPTSVDLPPEYDSDEERQKKN